MSNLEATTTNGAERMEDNGSTSLKVEPALFEEICQGLNLDEGARDGAWTSFVKYTDEYCLEVC